jgi:hypothetical protein
MLFRGSTSPFEPAELLWSMLRDLGFSSRLDFRNVFVCNESWADSINFYFGTKAGLPDGIISYQKFWFIFEGIVILFLGIV